MGGRMQIGSEEHKQLFCRTYIEGHRPYEPEELPWPALEGEPLELLQGIPFWNHAIGFESDAGPLIRACVEQVGDPLIREALSLQAYEEERHARILHCMVAKYGLEIGEIEIESVPPDAVAKYIDFGTEECLDSFGAFGIFQLAREAALLPDALFDIFDQVMNEEAHHIVFFVNWFAHREVNRGALPRALRHPRTLWHYAKAVRELLGLVTDGDGDEGQDFIMTGAQAFVDDLSPSLVMQRCLSENARRLAGFDPRLLQPRLAPRLARVGLAGLSLLPPWKSPERRSESEQAVS